VLHTTTIIQPSTQPPKNQQPRKPKRKDTQVPQPSDPIKNVVDKAVHKELGDSLVRAATTAFSLKAEHDSGNITKTQSKATPNESSSQGTNSGGGPRCQETIGDTTAHTRFESVSKHSNDSLLIRGFYELCSETKTTSNIIRLLFEKNGIFQEVEKKNRSRTHKLKRLYKVGLTAKVESSDNEESLGEDASKQGRIDAIDADEEITLKQNTAGDATTTGDDGDITLAQARIKMKSTKPKNKEKRAGTELIQENAKKQKVKDDKETVELKQCLEIIPDEEEVTIDAIPLAVKSPSIVGWKIHKEGRKSYYQIMRADGKSQMYMIFSHMLKSFNREDLEDLYKLVKAKYKSTRPVEDLDLLLWGDLKTMFEPHIYMLVEKKYPLAPLTLSMMLEKKLIIDYESEMAYQLLKFIIKQLKNIKELFWKVISFQCIILVIMPEHQSDTFSIHSEDEDPFRVNIKQLFGSPKHVARNNLIALKEKKRTLQAEVRYEHVVMNLMSQLES
ncbi:hypothetical protein Tco_0690075, partial [Tanacetum coccineum]